ncbi:hypothetical protein QQ045_006677 [Rhodiola kirilowii]
MADERKRRRMESNKESARRSRVKKQHQLQQVISDIDLYKRQNAEIRSKIEETQCRCLAVVTEINAVAAEKTELEQRLEQLIAIIDNAEKNSTRAAADVGCLSVDLPSIWRMDSWSDFSNGLGFDMDLSLSPWRSPPLMASAATMSRT